MHKKYLFYRRNTQKIIIPGNNFPCFVDEFILIAAERAAFPLNQPIPFRYNAVTLVQMRGKWDEREVVALLDGGNFCVAFWRTLRLCIA